MDSFVDSGTRERILSLVNPNRISFLDLGCGDGEFTQLLAQKKLFKKVYGIESDNNFVSQAENRGIIIKKADLDDTWPFPDNFFDFILANQVIEHVCDTDHFVKELYRVIHPSGDAIIATPNLASIPNLVSLLFGYQPLSAFISDSVYVGNPFNPANNSKRTATYPGHRRIFTLSALESFLKYYGFTIMKNTVCGWYPFHGRVGQILEHILPRYGAVLIFQVKANKSPNVG